VALSAEEESADDSDRCASCCLMLALRMRVCESSRRQTMPMATASATHDTRHTQGEQGARRWRRRARVPMPHTPANSSKQTAALKRARQQQKKMKKDAPASSDASTPRPRRAQGCCLPFSRLCSPLRLLLAVAFQTRAQLLKHVAAVLARPRLSIRALALATRASAEGKRSRARCYAQDALSAGLGGTSAARRPLLSRALRHLCPRRPGREACAQGRAGARGAGGGARLRPRF
jgi:hypothetical protein